MKHESSLIDVVNESRARAASANTNGDSVTLTGRLVARESLGPSVRDAMFDLMGDHFRGVERDIFEADLADKQWVILLDDPDGRLRGFSTLRVASVDVPTPDPTSVRDAAAASCLCVYSGDTIVDRAAWGTPALARLWIASVMRLCADHPERDVYWLLITSGFRTYRFLPVFYDWFYPRYDAPTPAATQRLIDALARERFGARYDAARGLVRFARPQVLQPDLLAVPQGRRVDPHIAFFLAQNPGYVHGDELVCLTRIARTNLTPAGRRMLDGRAPAWREG